jgi:hypothetical protein
LVVLVKLIVSGEKQMSLTSEIKKNEIQSVLKKIINRPVKSFEYDTFHRPPINQTFMTPQITGVAFDYLIRFFLERSNSKKMIVNEKWASKKASSYQNVDIISAETMKDKYLVDGKITEELINSVWRMSHIDFTYRSSSILEISDAPDEVIRDLLFLMKNLNKEDFVAKNICFLNPSFSITETARINADADFIIDDTIWELKVRKSNYIEPTFYYQLVAYILLSELGLINGFNQYHKINNIAFYYPRFQKIIKYPLDEIIPKKYLKDLVTWFGEGIKYNNYYWDLGRFHPLPESPNKTHLQQQQLEFSISSSIPVGENKKRVVSSQTNTRVKPDSYKQKKDIVKLRFKQLLGTIEKGVVKIKNIVKRRKK